MAEQIEVKEYAGGWITEKKHTEVPAFLRFAALVITSGCLAYLLWFMNGEIRHPDRGVLVQQFNAATRSSSGFMYLVAALIVLYLVIVARFVFTKGHEE